MQFKIRNRLCLLLAVCAIQHTALHAWRMRTYCAVLSRRQVVGTVFAVLSLGASASMGALWILPQGEYCGQLPAPWDELCPGLTGVAGALCLGLGCCGATLCCRLACSKSSPWDDRDKYADYGWLDKPRVDLEQRLSSEEEPLIINEKGEQVN